MVVETKIVGRRTPFERRPFEIPAGQHILKSLIEHLVVQELAAYHERQNKVGILRILTEQELKDGAAQGKIQLAPQEKSGMVTTEEAIQTALLGFNDGLYYVFVDDEQIETLDTPVVLKPDSTLLLLRLTALAGG